jgi:hypothetical protein
MVMNVMIKAFRYRSKVPKNPTAVAVGAVGGRVNRMIYCRQ